MDNQNRKQRSVRRKKRKFTDNQHIKVAKQVEIECIEHGNDVDETASHR